MDAHTVAARHTAVHLAAVQDTLRRHSSHPVARSGSTADNAAAAASSRPLLTGRRSSPRSPQCDTAVSAPGKAAPRAA